MLLTSALLVEHLHAGSSVTALRHDVSRTAVKTAKACVAQVAGLVRGAVAWARRHSWGVLLVSALLVSVCTYAGSIAVLRRTAGGEDGRQARAAIASAALAAATPGSVQARLGPAEQ